MVHDLSGSVQPGGSRAVGGQSGSDFVEAVGCGGARQRVRAVRGAGARLAEILCVPAERVVGNGNGVRCAGLSLPIPEQVHRGTISSR